MSDSAATLRRQERWWRAWAYAPFTCGCGERSTVMYDELSDQHICVGCGKSEPPIDGFDPLPELVA